LELFRKFVDKYHLRHPSLPDCPQGLG
jgi:hypothetical protein